MKATGYIRVSTEEQSREGISLEMQTSKIQTYCDLNDMDLTGIVEDAGISGKTIKARPGIQQILQMVKDKTTASVVVYKLDRLARNTIETLEMAQAMDKAGVALHSISEKLDTHSAMGRFFLTMLAALAQMEREVIAERTKDALAKKKEKNERVSFRPAWGYALLDDAKTIVRDAAEEQMIYRARELKDEGNSLRKIARTLENEGYRNKEGTFFHHQSIARMLRI